MGYGLEWRGTCFGRRRNEILVSVKVKVEGSVGVWSWKVGQGLFERHSDVVWTEKKQRWAGEGGKIKRDDEPEAVGAG